MFANSRTWIAVVFTLGACSLAGASCAKSPGRGGGPDSGSVSVSPLVISTATRTPRTTSMSVNYWEWPATFGDGITGTDSLVAALKPALMRVGGYNNDANTPPFDNAQFDKAVAYARAIGAEPVIQVPLLADNAGKAPTPDTAAAMVTYANVTKGYGIKYFSVGNEPDLYDTQGWPTNMSQPAIPGYTPSDYCTSVRAFVTAMKAVDPTIQIIGPDLSWKYQAGNSQNDWLTPVLTDCGDLFDVISIHRYPFEAAAATLSAAAADPAAFRGVVNSVFGILQATGQGSKPLALMEMNIVYDSTTCVLEASPGTVGSALWLADSVGTAIELGLWTTAVWDISDTDDWAFGLIGMPPTHTPRPPYYAYSLYADHFGPTLLNPPSAPAGVSAHASRNQADDATEVIVINWNKSPAGLSFQVTGLAKTPASTTFVLPPVSIAAVEIPDNGVATAWTYGEAQREVSSGPQTLAAGTTSTAAVDAGAAAGNGGAGRAVGTGCPTARGTDAGANLCTGPATGTLIDDMSGSSISLTPPACGTKGFWWAATGGDDSAAPGSLTVPLGGAATVSDCGSLCQNIYSPLPAGFPGSGATEDAGATIDVGASGDAGETPGPQAMCIAGQTGARQYAWATANLMLAQGGATDPSGALIDASAYSGIEFWMWVSPSTAASVSASFLAQLIDKNQIPEGGVCNVNSNGTTACASVSAGISGSTATQVRGAGPLFAEDGSVLTALSGGWQHVRAPWSSFLPNPYWGGANEQTVDPRTLAGMTFLVDNVSGPAVAFDYCIYQLSFLP